METKPAQRSPSNVGSSPAKTSSAPPSKPQPKVPPKSTFSSQESNL